MASPIPVKHSSSAVSDLLTQNRDELVRDCAEGAFRRTRRFARWRKLFRHDWILTAALVALDIGVWVNIYAGATFVRGDPFFGTSFQFALVTTVQLLCIVGALTVIGGYNRHTEWRALPYATEHVLALLAAGVISSLVIYAAATFAQTTKPSRAAFMISYVVFSVLALMYRRIARSFVAATTAHRAFLVVGAGDLAAAFYHSYKKSLSRERLEFVDVDKENVGKRIAGPGSPVIEGDLETKLDRLDQTYSGVVVAERIDRLHPRLLDRLVRTQFHQTRVYTLESFHESHWRHVPVQSLDPFWPLQRGFQLARNSPYHYAKRLFDIIMSLTLLLLTAPLFGIIVLLIWSQNGRPAIFTQTRVGRDDRRFTVYKFRTMESPTDEAEMDIYTRRGDPRVTKLGVWLRKMRLDELPQLVNVFRGEMSLIGPRAEWIRCAERYEKIIPFYHFRHLVKPGITGWAQVNYPYGESDEDAIEKLKYDLYYIRNYSLKLDLMIVLKTIYTVVFGKGQ